MIRAIKILLVEDDPDDVEMTREILKGSVLPMDLSVARDGIEALTCLREAVRSTKRPDLILLDLNMPRKNGGEVLREMKADEELKVIPVAIFTTSSSETDMERCRDLGADIFITKPVGLKHFPAAVKKIEEFWLSIAARNPSMC